MYDISYTGRQRVKVGSEGVRYSHHFFGTSKRVGGTLLTLKIWGFSDGVRYSEERILRHRRPNPKKKSARFARQETEQGFEVSALKYEPKLGIFDINILLMTTHGPLTTAAPPPDGVRYSVPKFKILKRIGGTLLTPQNPDFWIGGTLLIGGHYSQLGGTFERRLVSILEELEKHIFAILNTRDENLYPPQKN